MLTDTALRNFKPKSKTYKASDRDGMYVTVSSTGTVTFRFDYRLNGRRETLTIGRYGLSGISLAMAREKLLDAKKAVAQGKSPAHEKQREKRRLTAAKNFGDMTAQWLAGARMADSTRAMRKSIVDRDILPAFQNRLLNEITADDLRALCGKVKGRGAPATAVHVRDIVKQVYAFAILHGEKVDNPAADVGAASIATFVPKDRALSPLEIRLMSRQMESVATYPTIRLALRMILLTLVRKSELIEATWEEVDFENATWTVPKQRMKGRNPHVVYLSRQALDILVALHTCAAGSKFVLPSRYDSDRSMSHATLNRVTQIVAQRAKAAERHLSYCLQRGDVVIPSRGDYYQAWLFEGSDDPVFPVGQLSVIRPSPQLDARYLVWQLNEPSTQKRISLLLTGTTIKALTKAALLSLEVEIPPMSKQRQIAELDQTTQEIVAIRYRLNEIDRTEIAHVTRHALRSGAKYA